MGFKSNFLTRLHLCFVIACISFTSICFCETSSSVSDSKYSFDQIISDVYGQIGLSNYSYQDTYHTQTLSYLNRPGFRQSLVGKFKHDINRIGSDFFKNLFKQILDREIKFRKEYFVFYHGQQRAFKMLYDISRTLFEVMYKKTLADFIFMRFPEADFAKFNSVQDFLKKYIQNGKISRQDFDEIPRIRRRLLALNPCLFGNSGYLGESSFYYFVSSCNASGVDFEHLIYKMFQTLDLQDFYQEHKAEINEMLLLLSNYEEGQTGFLVQIFIPKNLVNNVVYRCHPWGLLYYQDDSTTHPAAQDLSTYINGSFSEQFKFDSEFDFVQFRALINQNMLDPAKGVKYFCYYKETDNLKKYNALYQKFAKKISDFVQLKKIKKSMFCWSSKENS